MIETHDTLKLVYLSLRETFVGELASLRKPKKIKDVIEKQKEKPQIQYLSQKGFTVDDIVEQALHLLQAQIFESTTKAKARFPEVFKTPASSSSTQKPSENKDMAPPPKPSEHKATAPAPKSSERKAINSSAAPAENVKPKLTASKIDADRLDVKTTDTKPQSQIPQKTLNSTISPGSVCLPFWYQHRVMVQVQMTLEKACFNFALKELGDIAQENAWDCAEAIELNTWPKILLEHQNKLDQKPLENVEKSLVDLLTSITQIRHTAVHRLRLPAKSALDLITDAEVLAELLQDDASIETISTIRQHVSVATEDLKETKRLLEWRLREIEKEYAEKRIQLANEEAALIASARGESEENDFFANANSHDTLDAIFAAQARWRQKGGVSLSIDEACGPEKRHGPDLETEAACDRTMPVEERAEPNGGYVVLTESHTKLGEECGHLMKDPNADLYDDVAMPTTTCETSGDHSERPKTVAMFGQPNLCLRAHAGSSLPILNNSPHSPSTSEREYWATPCGSKSPTKEAPAVNGFKDSAATSE